MGKHQLALIACVLSAWAGCMVGDGWQPGRVEAQRVTGTLQLSISDDFAGMRAETIYSIESPDGIVELRFADAPPPGLEAGMQVEAVGLLDGGKLRVAPGDNALTEVVRRGQIEQGLMGSAVTGTHSVIVIPVNFADDKQACTSAQINTLMFAPTSSVAAFYTEMSFGKFTFTGTVSQPITIDASTSAGCDVFGWGSKTDAAAKLAGVDVTKFQHVVYVFPPTASSCVVGLGNMPGDRVWIGGSYCDWGDVYAHELGHNIGMHHASTPASSYADFSDVMGYGLGQGTTGLRQTNGPHRFQVGWTQPQVITRSGTYQVRLLETAGTETQVIAFQKPGSTESYYLSYRRAVGFDTSLVGIESSWTGYGPYTDRINVHRYSSTASSVETMFVGSLSDGATFSDSGITVVQQSHDATTATVNVTFGTATVDTTAPDVLFTTPTTGSTVSGTVPVMIDANDNVAVASVRLAIDGTTVATLTAAPYTATWNTALTTNGTHTLVATATDTAGNATSATVQVTVNNGTPDTEPPTARITAPTAGATLAGSTTVTATATDNTGVTRAELYIDTSLVQTWTAAPYSYALDTTSLTNGSHVIRFTAFDLASNSATTSTTVTINNQTDTTAPTVSITSPSSGANVMGSLAVAVAASDNVTVTRVELYVDGSLHSATSAAPYGFTVSTTALANGSHQLVAMAYDGAANAATSTAVAFNVQNMAADTQLPTIGITDPLAGSTITAGSTTSITATATDNVGVSRVEIYVSGRLLCTRAAAPYTCDWRLPGKAGKSYTIQGRAYDAAGNVGSSALVTVRSGR